MDNVYRKEEFLKLKLEDYTVKDAGTFWGIIYSEDIISFDYYRIQEDSIKRRITSG